MDVFLSHTSEMRTFPERRSFVAAAERAVARAGGTVVDMAYLPARDAPAARVCRERMRHCDVYVGLIGFRYGSLVPDQPDVSYTELEFNTATETGIPRLIFLLDENAKVPFTQFLDRDYRERQESFRRRLMDSGIVIATFRNPDELETAVLHALVELRPTPGPGDRRGEHDPPQAAAGGRRPWMVPLRSARFVQRPELMSQLISLLTGADTGPVVLTAALQGTGGFGKTTLAEEVCRRPEIADRYPDGILWVTVGEHTAEVALASRINDLSLRLSGEHPTFSDPKVAGSHLGELLGTQRRLLVVDDVWSASQLQPFLIGGPGCVRLVTTRNRTVLPDGAVSVPVDTMNMTEAGQVLRGGLGEIPDRALQELLRLTGRWPVLLGLVNGAARGYVAGGASVADALERVTLYLRRGGPTTFDVANSDERRQAVTATVEASLSLLPADKLERYLELAVFPEDADIPCSLLERYFLATSRLDQVEVERFCRLLADLALILHYRLSPPRIQLHDVIRQYLRRRVGAGLAPMNRTLLDAVRDGLPDPADPPGRTSWWMLPESDEYLWRNLTFHLREAELQAELDTVVCDLRYLTAKIRMLGPVATEADLALATSPAAAVFRTVIGQGAHLLHPIRPSFGLATTLLNRLDGIEPVAFEVADFARWLGVPYLRNRWAPPDLPDPSLRRVLSGHDGIVFCAAIDPQGRWLASGGDDGKLAIWDSGSGLLRQLVDPHQGTIWACAASPDGSWLATAGNNGTVRTWDAGTGTARHELAGGGRPLLACAIEPRGRWLAAAGDDGLIRIWDAGTGELLRTLESHQGTVWTCAISPDGSWLATAGDDGSVRIWDVETGKIRRQLAGHTAPVWDCAVSADGSWFATAGGDGLVVIWDAVTGRIRHSLTGHVGPVYACAASPDGSWLATAGGDRRIRIWDVSAGRMRRSIEGHAQPVWACAAAPDGDWIATGGADATVRVWSVTPDQGQHFPVRHSVPTWACAAPPNGSWLAASGADGPVRVWDIATDRVRYRVGGESGLVWACAAPADGGWLATAGTDGMARIWAAADGKPGPVLAGHTGPVWAAAAAADSSWLATAGDDGTVRIWDTASGQLRDQLDGHTGPVWAAAAAADSSWLATAGDDGTVRIWDTASGQLRDQLDGHAGPVWAAAAAAGGWLATIGADQTVRVWNIGARSACVTVIRVSDPIRDCCWVQPGSDLCVCGDAGMYLFSMVLPGGGDWHPGLAEPAPEQVQAGRDPAAWSHAGAGSRPGPPDDGASAQVKDQVATARPPRDSPDRPITSHTGLRLPEDGEVGYFLSVTTGDVIDVAGWSLNENGTPVVPWHKKTADVYNQQWSAVATTAGGWQLSPLSAPEKALDVFHAPARYRLSDMAMQWDIHHRASQEWQFVPAGHGFRIVNRDSAGCITYLHRGNGFLVLPPSQDLDQLWQFLPISR